MLACFLAHRDCSGLRRLSFKTDWLSSVPVTKRQLLWDFVHQNKLEFPLLNQWFSLLCPSSLKSVTLPSHSCWSQICLWLLNLNNPFLLVTWATKNIFPGWLVQNLCQRGLAQEICWIAQVLPYHPPKGRGGKALSENQGLVSWDSFHMFEYNLHFRLGLLNISSFKNIYFII